MTTLRSLPVLTDSVLAPRWADISRAATRAAFDDDNGFPFERTRKARLLTPPGANAKLSKGLVPIYGLTLAPAGMSGYQLCPWRSPECEAACLGKTSGRSRFSNVQEARILKTRYLMENPYRFFRQLYSELTTALSKHGPDGFAFRSNVLSDIPWEKIAPQIYDFTMLNYDYTKSFKRAVDSLSNPNLHLTLSYSGHNYEDCIMYLNMGGNVAVVFSGDLPERHWGVPVINGDLHDARFLDPKGGCIVGLKAKGNIDTSSCFVVTP